MFNGNMNSQIINYDTNKFGCHPTSVICIFGHNEIDVQDITNRISGSLGKMVMHNSGYIHYVDLWNWKFDNCLLGAQRNNRTGSGGLGLSDNGLMIPVIVNRDIRFNQIYDLNNNALLPIRNYYAHLNGYNGYAASYRFISSKLLAIDYGFVEFLRK